ncbi:hypothetical protein CPU12_01475 [Malaciobacter molluscorum LMG 25693]|uniref:Uncharacterized protein n=1 Tax=Malaciobacter molluscorum LMG 25693 TaxID=870501 RepID=A0A2G1DLV9_9BACT|nr:hypothetical protein [Malaciobacter molluscorum]AXX92251.1 hypothetical protein AMOL_1270 [Malaciobacter molluscorum LMG 25693]PHO19478.1 hypothetical protein CPU12_01475 [Malaciobacter molluscorum LMG 25693]
MSWKVTANDIKNWSLTNSREAQETLPKLVKNLILATSSPKYIDLPSGDSIQVGGWDGVLNVEEGNSFIPSGESRWEFGTDKNINPKAEKDYKKRTDSEANLNQSYIFVTTQIWNKKQEFEKNKNQENKWKEVRGINASDLETWLELAPAVHRWFSKSIGKRPENALDIKEAFSRWSNQTEIKLSKDLVILSREEDKKKLIEFLEDIPSKIVIVSQSEQESYIFSISALLDEEKFSNKVLIVESQNEWDNLISSKYSLILIPQNFSPVNIGQAVANGHFVIQAEEEINSKEDSSKKINLKKIWKEQKSKVLEDMGLDIHKAYELLNETKGFLHAIEKHRFLKPIESYHIPLWVEEFDINILSTILFINSWNGENEHDKKILESLSELSYLEFEKHLESLKVKKESPIRKVGNIWQVISKVNLWDLISNRIPTNQIDKLEDILIEIFGEIDPIFAVDKKKRFYTFDKKLKYSGLIRESLADTICLISALGKNNLSYSKDINKTLSNWLEKLYNKNLNVESWYSYHHQLILLAETDPSSFLTALEKTIDNAKNQIEKLFESEDFMTQGCDHCDLVWALETISWNDEYIIRIVRLLIKLSKIEIKMNISNTPFNTLIHIFLGWINYSSLNYDEKIQILENIMLKEDFDITWKLLIELLPDRFSSASPLHTPKYNIWNEKLPLEVFQSDYYNYENEICRILLENTNENVNKWANIFENIDKFTDEYFIKVNESFCKLDINTFSEKDKLKIATIIRENIHNHKKYANSDWTREKDEIEILEKSFYFIEPQNLVYKYKYLFEDFYPKVLNLKTRDDDFEREDREYDSLRIDALKEILKYKDFDTLLNFISECKYPNIIAKTFAKTDVTSLDSKIYDLIKSEDKRFLEFVQVYISSLYFNNKLEIDNEFLSKYADEEQAKVLLSLNFKSKIFELLKECSEKTQEYYWQNNNNYFLLDDGDLDYFKWVFEQLLKFNRPMKAVDFVYMVLQLEKKGKIINIDLDLIHQALILLATKDNGENLTHYEIHEVLEYYQNNSTNINKNIELEWIYVSFDDFKPLNIEQKVIESPEFFVELISYIYKSDRGREKEENLTDEQIKIRAETAWKVLEKLSLFSDHIKEKSLNSDYLKDWVIKAQELFKKVDRVKIGDDKIGQILSKSPKGKDDIWPCESVREVLQLSWNKTIETGLLVGKKNQRGFVWRDKGGKQEYKLAKQYKDDAQKIKYKYPKTFELLITLSKWYEDDGKRKDLEEELR